MLSVEEALEQVLSRVSRLGAEQVDLLACLGRVLAESIAAPCDIPPWSNSSMDGYALLCRDTAAATPESPADLAVVGTIPAGSVAPGPIRGGEAFRIFTGAPLPEGADAVIPQEEVEVRGAGIRLRRPVHPGEFVRPVGEDIRAGETALEAGQVIGPAEIGLLATLGRSRVLVFRRPRVAILSTGDEVVDLGGDIAPGKIPNSNTYALMAQVLEAGGEPMNIGVASDNRDAIEEHLQRGLSADVLISSAGVSVGEYDLVREALNRLGAELHLWQVAMRPGKPITFGSMRGRPVFGLPGNPVSAMVTFELFVRPALRKMAGHPALHRPLITARALSPIPNPGHRRGYLRVTVTADGGEYRVRLTGNQGSAILRSMVAADGLAVVSPDTTIPEGGEVPVLLLKPLREGKGRA
ncbi:MAG: molybdopterin molybdotransferase MoeA [Candidatus Rokubacteria bacterium]|nr:molybdopterin molybdotransferase MoeA [Candidatus Rokubacteria bacterium]